MDTTVILLVALIGSLDLTRLALQGADIFTVFTSGAFTFIAGGLCALWVVDRLMAE